MDIGIVTDEVSRNLAQALEVCAAWGLSRFELREGAAGRFPFFTPEEILLIEETRRQGSHITAVSPGICKGAAEDERRLTRELGDVLPHALDLAAQFACPVLIVFGFERYAGEPEGNRVRVLRAFERVAEAAAEAGLVAAVENEPGFWIDDPAGTRALLDELGHPSMRVNWDPANLQWGGKPVTYEGFQQVRPRLANLHVKDFIPRDPAPPSDPEVEWCPVGKGAVPWAEVIGWVRDETDLAHATLETHCEPLVESSRASLEALRSMIAG